MSGPSGLKGMQFDRTINLGNIVSWGLIAVGAFATVLTNMNATQNLENRFNERRPIVDAGIKTANDAYALSQQNAREVEALKTADRAKGERLDLGYRERRDSEERQAKAIGDLATAQALTNQKVDGVHNEMQLFRRAIEAWQDGKPLRRPSVQPATTPHVTFAKVVVPATKARSARVVSRKMPRPRTALVGLFSARPFYRGPYLGSLQRHGMIR